MSESNAERSDCHRGMDAGAYVLHALSADESRSYTEHLPACDRCRLEVQDLRLVVDTLPIAAPQTTPPVALKRRIMAVVNQESELLLAAGPEAHRPSARKAARRRWRPAALTAPLRPAFVVALGCALLGLGVVGGLVVEGVGAPETRTLAAWAKGPATAQLTQTGENASLQLTDMPSPPRGEVYQVWFDRGDGQLRPTHTLFNVRSDGRAKVAIEEPVKGVERILVTAEPSSGSLAPSAGPVITASPA